MNRICAAALLGIVTAAHSALAAITVDGTKDVDYGPAWAVQTVQTAWTDNANELNAAYAVKDGGRLYLMFTGNLDDNFNHLEIFIDSKAGGQSVFDSSGNDNSAAMDGLVFDTGFTADYYITARRGTDLGNPQFNLDFADLASQSASGYFDIFGGSGTSGSGSTGTGVNASPIEAAYNGSNAAGITGGTGAANQVAALAVMTGFELSIDLDDLGYTNGTIRVMVGINNTGTISGPTSSSADSPRRRISSAATGWATSPARAPSTSRSSPAISFSRSPATASSPSPARWR